MGGVIRNNCGGKQLWATQVVKTSEVRNRPTQGRSKTGWGVYRASAGVWSADLQTLRGRGSVGSIQQHEDTVCLQWEP